MNICVVGAGAIGGWVAAKLALAGERVAALASSGPLDRIELTEDGDTSTAELHRLDAPADLLIIAVKAKALSSAAEASKSLDRAEHDHRPDAERRSVVVRRRGEPALRRSGRIDRHRFAVRSNRRMCGARFLPADRAGSRHRQSCRQAAHRRTGRRNRERSARLSGFSTAPVSAPISTGNVRRAIWYKLWGNATINPLSALVRTTCDRILADPECRAWMLEGMTELARSVRRSVARSAKAARSGWR